VEPKIFLDQLKYKVSRCKFGLCIIAVDASYQFGTHGHEEFAKCRRGHTLNKIDLFPCMNHKDQQALGKNKTSKSIKCNGSYAANMEMVPGFCWWHSHVEFWGSWMDDVFVVGAANVGKSS
jgi:hypothetical protein